MAIDFGPGRWQRIRQTYEAFWQGTLTRPVVPVRLAGRDPSRRCPDAPPLNQGMALDFSIPAEAIADRMAYELSCYTYLGDAFPVVNFDAFGPGALAALCGATPRLSATGNIWFQAPERPLKELHIQLDTGCAYAQRMAEVYGALLRRFQGQVLLTMVDLGGTMDLVACMRGSQNLLLDLYDAPEEVLRLREEAHQAWWQAYDFINGILQPRNPGYSDWSQLFYPQPGYILQCDFAYMIGPDMFQEYVLEELRRSTERLSHSFYHLDGVGQLPHLDALLSLPRLQGIQWVPGDGQPPQRDWPEVYRKVSAAGARVQLIHGRDNLEAILSLPGQRPGGIQQTPLTVTHEQLPALQRDLAAWNVEL